MFTVSCDVQNRDDMDYSLLLFALCLYQLVYMLFNFPCISVVAVSVSHFNASSRKGNRLLLDFVFSE